MKFFRLRWLASLLLMAGVFGGCKHEPGKAAVEPEPTDNYPSEVGRIIRTNCAVAGCHNTASHQVSGGGLLMDSWEHLFDGGNHGATIIPYSPENSSLLFFVNSFPDLGPVPSDPGMKMPLNGTPLSRADYMTLRSWIAAGAPDKSGNIPFASNADSRQKIYLAHQGCDYISVIDAEKHVVMRTIPVGERVTIESAYDLKVSPDGVAYLSMWSSDGIYLIDTKSDSVSGRIDLGMANSNRLHLSPNGKELLAANWFTSGVMRVNTESRAVTGTLGVGEFSTPHGIASNRTFDTFFVTELTGNIVHRVAANGSRKAISIDGTPPTTAAGKADPRSILMVPDYSRYFLACEGSNELRVMDARTNALLATIPIGLKPQEMAISRDAATPFLFVTCADDVNAGPNYRGAVYVINYNTYALVEKISERFYMPHALAVDDRSGMLYVFSRNIDPSGPEPHHNSAACEGRSGYYSIYDFRNKRPLNNKRYEVTVDPFAADARFK